MASFVGDGQHVGDGGAHLQQLWDVVTWKEIRNCPGRYVIKHNKQTTDTIEMTTWPLPQLLERVYGVDLAASMVVHELQSPKCIDPVHVVVFPDGGGIITYCKRRHDDNVFVHTLNTASGLARKLTGLQLAHVLLS